MFKQGLFKKISILLATFILLTLVRGNNQRKQCNYEVTNSFTTIYSDSSQDGDIMYVFSSNQSECDLDLIGVYNNYTANITTNKTKLFVSFKLICDDNRTIHFTIAPEAPKKRRQPVLSVELLLNGCSISVLFKT